MKNPRIFLPVLLVVFCTILAKSSANKICWVECEGGIIIRANLLSMYLNNRYQISTEGANKVKSVSVGGCHRRPGFNGRPAKFRCDGEDGPPCIVMRGDVAKLTVKVDRPLGA